MKILWFSIITPSSYFGGKASGYNGGGWISSLERELVKFPNIRLGIAFMTSKYKEVITHNGVKYYPILYPQKKLNEKWKYFFDYSTEEEIKPYLNLYKDVVDDFSPDVIHIFGSETPLGFVQKVTNVPCILHIQGILNPYKNAFFPPGFSKISYLFRSCNIKNIIKSYREMKTWENSCLREEILLKEIKNYLGRTLWDKIVTKTINPEARYFYGSEILRPLFYSKPKESFPEIMTLVSTSSGVLYKGFDLILKTAYILKNHHNYNFKWLVFGNYSNLKFIEKLVGINHETVNITMMGIGKEEDIYNALLSATTFVHPSYIDNSSNAVCEAQLVGCPVVATDVGGMNSLIEDKVTGFLVPSNDPYKMAWRLKELHEDKQLAIKIGNNSRNIAIERHNKTKIVNDLINVYETLHNEYKES